MDLSSFTPEQIAQLRSLLNQHDSGESGKIKEFDLNNPPVPPYRYQAFPKTVYHSDGRNRIVQNQAQLDQHLQDGWATSPQAPAAEDAAVELDAATIAEAEAIDRQLTKKARK